MMVNWSERAALELAETAAYVAREFGRRSAVDMRNTIHEAVDDIARFPMIGKISFTDDENGVEFRELACRLITGGTASVKVYGNIMSLVDETGYETATTVVDGAFANLFYANSTLTDASGLLLPATTLDAYCYDAMFRECSSLTAAPALPATELATGCYGNMFQNCISLTTSPVLPATALAVDCYTYMFCNCSSLSSVTCLATLGTNNGDGTVSWLSGAGPEGPKTFTAAPSAIWPEGASGIPNGWTRVDAE